MEEQLKLKIKALCDALLSLRGDMQTAYAMPDKTAFYAAIPRCQKLAAITGVFLNTMAAVSEGQKKMDALKNELGL